jgi:prevent-host-death family protein
MATATVRDLRTQFPRIRRLLEQEGEVIVTDHGRPVVVLRPYEERSKRNAPVVDYFERLRRRMPQPLSERARRALEDENRGER